MSVIDLLMRSAALLGVMWVVTAGIDRAGGSAAMRHLAWLLGFAGLFLLPIIAALAPALPIPVLPATATAPSQFAVATEPTEAPSAGLLPLAYALVATVLMARLIMARIALARMWSQARPIESAATVALVATLSASFGLRRPVAVRTGAPRAVPMTWGLFQPRILIPAEAAGWSAEQLRIVLLHELGHVARKDSVARTLAATLCALYWLNPAMWLAAARMRREQEHACDDLVLEHGADPHHYARQLLCTARALTVPAPSGLLAPGIVGRSELEQRLTAIVGDVPRGRAGGLAVTAGSITAFALAALIGAIVPVALARPEPARASSAPAASLAAATGPHARIRAERATAPSVPPVQRIALAHRPPPRVPALPRPPVPIEAASIADPASVAALPTLPALPARAPAPPAVAALPPPPAVVPVVPVTPPTPPKPPRRPTNP